MKPLSERSTIRPSCKVNFNICVDCGVVFTAHRITAKRCPICNEQTTKIRKIKGLVKLKRKCINPACCKPFITYDKTQFACSTKCSNIVVSIRRRYDIKLRRFLSICTDCGKDAFTHSLCKRCYNRRKKIQEKNRNEWKNKGYCHECGRIVVDGLTKCASCSSAKKRRNYKSFYKRKGSESFVEYVDILILFNRDNGRCRICGKKVNIKLKYPHPNCATRDHIVPVSKGGKTSYKNMQLAHLKCNLSKGNRPVEGGEQLRLFG